VEVPPEQGGAEFLDMIGGFFETHWSVNPHWMLAGTQLAEGHPITRGVESFEIQDEWYYHMRFRDGDQRVVPILTAIPPDATRERPDGPHSNNPTVRANKGAREVLAWAYERPDGGRGFGCTGAHFHSNFGNEQFRKLMLNAVAWTAGLNVPEAGLVSEVAEDDLVANLDSK
jgi:type 1 glutamine amidotransferase